MLGKLTDRMLGLLVPKARAAAASCWVDATNCERCAGAYVRKVTWYLCSDGSAYRTVTACRLGGC
ncbi:hypothetical protein [Longispora albida]|uniref:hypothetical protein n=1 Tax=Longispora albida TaxID=203523 RepID=UPI0003736028|nr:hypothetical protein [Longispora albida]